MPEAAPRVEPEQALFELVRPRWQARAACRPDVIPHVWQQFEDCDSPLDLFYPTLAPSEERIAAIESVCEGCPVQSECRAWGFKHEKYGWWGGSHPTELDDERKEQGLPLPPALEVDPRTRQVIGTFIDPAHGSRERYQWHLKDGEPPCEACTSAWTEFYKPVASARYAAKRAAETPEEHEEKNRQDRARRDAARKRDRG